MSGQEPHKSEGEEFAEIMKLPDPDNLTIDQVIDLMEPYTLKLDGRTFMVFCDLVETTCKLVEGDWEGDYLAQAPPHHRYKGGAYFIYWADTLYLAVSEAEGRRLWGYAQQGTKDAEALKD